jgi:predicted small integral membrane protein
MMITALALVVLALTAMAWHRSRPPAGQPRQGLATVAMTLGALLAVTAGGFAVFGLILAAVYAGTDMPPGWSVEKAMLLALPAAALVPGGAGIWLYRLGRARLRTPGRDG